MIEYELVDTMEYIHINHVQEELSGVTLVVWTWEETNERPRASHDGT